MSAVLAPADSPSAEQFTFGNVAAELEPRRANLSGTPSAMPMTPTLRPTDRTSPPTAADAADGVAA